MASVLARRAAGCDPRVRGRTAAGVGDRVARAARGGGAADGGARARPPELPRALGARHRAHDRHDHRDHDRRGGRGPAVRARRPSRSRAPGPARRLTAGLRR